MNTGMKLLAVSLVALLTAACASNSTPSAASKIHAWKSSGSAKGKIFTDQSGQSLYTFKKDASGVSNCYSACAVAWPPFTAAADATTKGEWSLISRKDGSKQWALNGMPLYYFAADKAAGDVKGDGVGGVWHLARPVNVNTQSKGSY